MHIGVEHLTIILLVVSKSTNKIIIDIAHALYVLKYIIGVIRYVAVKNIKAELNEGQSDVFPNTEKISS